MTILDEKYILDVKGLNVYFKTQHGRLDAIKGLDFHVKQGEVLGIIGESGCGKSVTSLSVMGLIEPPGRLRGRVYQIQGQGHFPNLQGGTTEATRKRYGDDLSGTADLAESAVDRWKSNL